MGIAFAALGPSVSAGLSLVLAPLQALVSFFAPWQPQGDRNGIRQRASSATDFIAAEDHPARTQRLSGAEIRSQGTVSRPLRVVRVVDGNSPRHSAGRMVISGRMADVCAELDRLARLEGA
jgi:hypothetical protein